MRNEKNKELPWLMMLSATDYRKKNTDKEILLELEEWAMNREQVREALIEWETLSANKENRGLYEAKAKELRDLLSNIEGEVKAEKRKIVLKMLEKGYDVSTISEITELSEQEILQLRNQN